MISERIRNEELRNRVVTAEEAASWIENGMGVGFSGFTSCGDAKAVAVALTERVKKENTPLKIKVYTGASVSPEIDTLLSDSGIMAYRFPFQSDKACRTNINKGNVNYVDAHLSENADTFRTGVLPVDVAIVEALSISEEGYIYPTTSGGNNAIFVDMAKEVIIELNIGQPLTLEGIHDVYDPGMPGERGPIPISKVDDRIGMPYIKVDPAKIKGIVITNTLDTPKSLVAPDEDTTTIANNLINFLRDEIKAGRLPQQLPPLQSGVGFRGKRCILWFLTF